MSGPVVETSGGLVRGVSAGGVQAFAGVPYAQAGRFGPPRPVPPWTGVREATEYGPSAPQPPPPQARLDRGAAPPAGEDCLVLNVWTSGGSGRPVLVWLHGGGFSTGSGSQPWTSGAALARRGEAVVVTLNHRLGLLGFLDLGAVAGERYAGAANAGMLDLVAALEWVRDNAAAFGGDPGRVTVFGESGGGGKVCALLAMPAAAGLFHRAAIQSGVFLGGAGEVFRTPASAAATAERVVAEAGGVDALLAAPVERVLELQQREESRRTPGSAGLMPFCPLVDGATLADHPRAALAAGAAADIPLVLGTNSHETALFLWLSDPAFRADPAGWRPDDEQLVARLRPYAGAQAAELVERYRELRPGADNAELYVAISSDNMRLGAIRLAEARLAAGGARVHAYLFAWESPVAGGALGAAHGFEIPFVFDTAGERAATREGPGRARLAAAMSGAWTSFAATGAPEVPGLGAWPAYDAPRRGTVLFDAEPRLVDDPFGAERRAWPADLK